MTDQPADNKRDVRDDLDLTGATWTRAEPPGQHLPDAYEVAHVPHTDGVTYTVVRRADQPDGTTLVYDPDEWAAFVAGAKDGEFDPET